MESSVPSAKKKPKRGKRNPAGKINPTDRRTWPHLTPRDRGLIEDFIGSLIIQAGNGLSAAQEIYNASGGDPSMIPQLEHFRGYLKAFRWALLRAGHRQLFLAERVLSGTPYPDVEHGQSG